MKEANYPGMPAPKELLEDKSLKNILGNTEAEGVLAILLRFSYEAGKWVAPTLEELVVAINKAVDTTNTKDEIRRRNAIKRHIYERKRKWSWFLKLIGKDVTEPVYEETNEAISVTNVSLNDATEGLKFLKLNGYIGILDRPDGKYYVVLTHKAMDKLK